MRLGAQEVLLAAGSRAREIYGKESIAERHRHRYEFNNTYMERFRNAGLRFSGFSRDGLVEMIELPTHPWFVASQFHPEFTSTPRDGHPLFTQLRAGRARASLVGAAASRGSLSDMKLAGFDVGIDRPFFLIAGPCVIESQALVEQVAGALKEITGKLGIPYIFKASFDKANRSSKDSFRGPGLEGGLEDPRRRARQVRRAGAHGRARRHALQRSGRRRRRDADAGVPRAARPISS